MGKNRVSAGDFPNQKQKGDVGLRKNRTHNEREEEEEEPEKKGDTEQEREREKKKGEERRKGSKNRHQSRWMDLFVNNSIPPEITSPGAGVECRRERNLHVGDEAKRSKGENTGR